VDKELQRRREQWLSPRDQRVRDWDAALALERAIDLQPVILVTLTGFRDVLLPKVLPQWHPPTPYF